MLEFQGDQVGVGPVLRVGGHRPAAHENLAEAALAQLAFDDVDGGATDLALLKGWGEMGEESG